MIIDSRRQLNHIGSSVDQWPDPASYIHNVALMEKRSGDIVLDREEIKAGGGPTRVRSQHKKNRLTAWERIDLLADPGTDVLSIGTFAGWKLYNEPTPAGGVIVACVIVSGRPCIVVAHDATIKAGAYFEITCRKTIRAQEIAMATHSPIIYLVDSAGIFLPRQEEAFAGDQHFGRIFSHNAKLSAAGIPQIAAVMGSCVAGGAYLPLMCDTFLIVEGASLFLAGPALVKSAINEDVDSESLGGAHTHTAISGIADYREPDEPTCLQRIRDILATINWPYGKALAHIPARDKVPSFPPKELAGIPVGKSYEIREVIARLVDDSHFIEYKMNYGQSLVTGTASIGGVSLGIVANQRIPTNDGHGRLQLGGVIYADSADKAARFILKCNQDRIPILFIHDVMGFMVGKDAEQAGIGKSGAKMVHAVANSVVPKISLVIGGSFGAGNYAMCGRAYDPTFLFAWPSAQIAVMGPNQAASTLLQIKLAKEKGMTEADQDAIKKKIIEKYEYEMDPRYAAARLWVDEIIQPEDTRTVLINALNTCRNRQDIPISNIGVIQT